MGDSGLLTMSLELAVPIRIAALRGIGWDERYRLTQAAMGVIAEHGDDILFRSRRPGGSAEAFTALVTGLAVLAYAPGGVRFAGLHFEALPPGDGQPAEVAAAPARPNVTPNAGQDNGAVVVCRSMPPPETCLARDGTATAPRSCARPADMTRRWQIGSTGGQQ